MIYMKNCLLGVKQQSRIHSLYIEGVWGYGV